MRNAFRLIAAFTAALAYLLAPGEAQAWGRNGHLVVCDLAYRNFTPATRQAVIELLQSRQGGTTVRGRDGMPRRHYTAFNIGCLEEDETPRRHPADHFINLPRSTVAITGNACPAGAACVLSGIERDLAILADRTKPREDRVFALMALGHWIGDIHQPLHVSFADDRGGNSLDVTMSGRCGTAPYRPANLHAVWDNCLLEAGLFQRVRQRADFSPNWGRNTITYRAVDTLQANTGLEEERRIVAGEPWQWAQESYAIALEPDVRYCLAGEGGCRYSAAALTLEQGAQRRRVTVDQAYRQRFAPVAQERVRLAGFRLAHLVNRALDPAYDQPVRNSTQPP